MELNNNFEQRSEDIWTDLQLLLGDMKGQTLQRMNREIRPTQLYSSLLLKVTDKANTMIKPGWF